MANQGAHIKIGTSEFDTQDALWKFTAESRLLFAGGDILAYIQTYMDGKLVDFVVIRPPKGKVMLFAQSKQLGAVAAQWQQDATALYHLAKAKWDEFIVGTKFPSIESMHTNWREWVFETFSGPSS